MWFRDMGSKLVRRKEGKGVLVPGEGKGPRLDCLALGGRAGGDAADSPVFDLVAGRRKEDCEARDPGRVSPARSAA